MTTSAPARRWPIHLAAGAAAAAGVAAQLARPLAPDLGAPPAASTAFDAAFLARSAAYNRPLYIAIAAAVAVRVIIALLVALTPQGRRFVAGVVGRIGAHRPARAAAACVLLIVAVTDLVLSPLAFWANHVHGSRFGLVTQGAGGWLAEWSASHLPVWVGVTVLTLAGFWLARRLPFTWAPVGGLAAGLLAGVVTFVSPLVLEPLTLDFRPLEAGAVRTDVERVLDAADTRVDRILVADASRRTTRQNAYVSGFGATRRVVLYDTLVNARPPAEVALVLAHEVGHARNADLWRLVGLSVAGGVLSAYALMGVLAWRASRGRQRGVADPTAAGVIVLTLLALSLASTPVQTLVSRRAEAAADLRSLELTDDARVFTNIQTALATANLSDPDPPGLATWWLQTHPSAMARLAMARWWSQR